MLDDDQLDYIGKILSGETLPSTDFERAMLSVVQTQKNNRHAGLVFDITSTCLKYKKSFSEHNIGLAYDVYEDEQENIHIDLRGIYCRSSQVYCLNSVIPADSVGTHTYSYWTLDHTIRAMFERIVKDLEQREEEVRRLQERSDSACLRRKRKENV